MPATNETVTNVLRLANEVNSLARKAGRADLSETLAQVAARWKEAETTIVVAGAQKRGKSRLINSLMGRPGLLPVDADVATNCHLSLRHGPVLSAVVTHADGAFPIDPEQIPEYASMSGDPAKRRDVVSVDLTLEHPLLDGVRLLDTPGVDSLTVGHRQATVAILQRADALLFTLSAQDQPVLRHELEFLAEAMERVQAVAFVLTKVEDSTNWQALLEENRRRLEAFVAEARRERPESDRLLGPLLDAPWLPVSAKLAEAAAAQRALDRPERADQLRARSGMDRLEEYVRACAGGRDLARSATVVSACASVLAAMGALAEDGIAGASDDTEDSAQRLADVEKALEELAETTRGRRRHGVGIQFLGREVAGIVRVHLARVRQPYEQAISDLGTRADLDRYVEQLPESVERSVQAAWEDILAEVGTLVGDALNTFLSALGLDRMEMDLAKVAVPKVWSHDLTSEPSEGGKIDMVREGVPHAMMAVTMGAMLASLVTPALFVVGPALAVAVLTRRRQWEQIQRNQNALRRLLTEQFNQAASEMTLTLEREVANCRVTVEQSADQALAAQKRELESRRAELRSSATRDANGRRTAREQAVERLATITSLTERCATLRGEIAAAVNSLGR